MKPGEVAVYLGIGRSTVTAWTSGEFKPYFSPSAQGGAGRDRVFTETDLRIMYLIKLRKDENTPSDQLRAELEQLRKQEWDGLPNLPAAAGIVASVPVMPTSTAQAYLTSESKGLLREIVLLNEQIDELKAALQKRDGEKEQYLREVADLGAKLAVAETILKLYETGRLKPAQGGGS